jgi:hypothetical protein
MVESQPSKLLVASSILVSRSISSPCVRQDTMPSGMLKTLVFNIC